MPDLFFFLYYHLAKCSDKFARPDSGGKGVFIGGPVNWSKHDNEKIAALEMNFVVKHAGSAGAIWAELEGAVARNDPIVIYNWSPNFVGAKYAGKFIEFPKNFKEVDKLLWNSIEFSAKS